MDHLDVRLVVAARSSLSPERAVSTREPALRRHSMAGGVDRYRGCHRTRIGLENPYAHCRKCVSANKIGHSRKDAGRQPLSVGVYIH